MHSEIRFPRLARFVLAALVAPAAALALQACGGSAGGGSAAAQKEAHPGHGNASIVGQDLTAGDRSNAFNSTDDPTDPNFVPTKSPLKHYSTNFVQKTASPLSTVVGTPFQITYYVVSDRPKNDASETSMYDCDGNYLTDASWAWQDDALMQGTARYVGGDGATHTINAGNGCWVQLDYSQRWGLGVENPATGDNFNLRVFRSIAVDRNVLTIGKWYYVKELDGVTMPAPAAGMKHDGCVRAVDVGPAINGKHIDFFSGLFSAYQSLINGHSSMGGKESITLFDGASKCQSHISRGY